MDDDFGRTGLNQVFNEVESQGVCIAFKELLPTVKSQEIFQRLGEAFCFHYMFYICCLKLFEVSIFFYNISEEDIF